MEMTKYMPLKLNKIYLLSIFCITRETINSRIFILELNIFALF